MMTSLRVVYAGIPESGYDERLRHSLESHSVAIVNGRKAQTNERTGRGNFGAGQTEATVVLVVIGRQGLRTDNRRARWIRDLTQALRDKCHIIPVLVHRATMPRQVEVKDSLRPLLRLQAHELTDEHWKEGVSALVDAVLPFTSGDRTAIEDSIRLEKGVVSPVVGPSEGSARVRTVVDAPATRVLVAGVRALKAVVGSPEVVKTGFSTYVWRGAYPRGGPELVVNTFHEVIVSVDVIRRDQTLLSIISSGGGEHRNGKLIRMILDALRDIATHDE